MSIVGEDVFVKYLRRLQQEITPVSRRIVLEIASSPPYSSPPPPRKDRKPECHNERESR
jgi:hypothetical protein